MPAEFRGHRTYLDGNACRGILRIEIERMQKHVRTGRPLGEHAFVKALQRRTGRVLVPGQPGPHEGLGRVRRRRRR